MRRLRRYDEALLSYDAAIKLKDDDSIAWLGHGNSLRNLQRHDEAIISYEKAIHHQPGFDLALYSKARSHALKGDKDLAIASLETAVNLHPEKYRELVKLATYEPDFDEIKNDERFQKLIGD